MRRAIARCSPPAARALLRNSSHAMRPSGPRQPGPLRRPLLLVSDFDDTLVPGAHSHNASDADTAALRDALQSARAAGKPPVKLGASLGLFLLAAALSVCCCTFFLLLHS